MLSRASVIALIMIAVPFVGSAPAQSQYGVSEGTITGVKLAADMNSLTINYEGLVGKSSSFVMGGPYRLVIDFDGARLGRIPGKTKIDKAPIREIRVGQTDARARVVVDFDDNPAPPFTVHRGPNQMVVMFGKRLAPGIEAEKEARSPQRKPVVEAARKAAPVVIARGLTQEPPAKFYKWGVQASQGAGPTKMGASSSKIGGLTVEEFHLESPFDKESSNTGDGWDRMPLDAERR